MRSDRLARPQRTGFAGGVVADGEDEIEIGAACLRELGQDFERSAETA